MNRYIVTFVFSDDGTFPTTATLVENAYTARDAYEQIEIKYGKNWKVFSIKSVAAYPIPTEIPIK